MCLSQRSAQAHELAEKLIARGWHPTSAYRYALSWQRKVMYSEYLRRQRETRGSSGVQ